MTLSILLHSPGRPDEEIPRGADPEAAAIARSVETGRRASITYWNGDYAYTFESPVAGEWLMSPVFAGTRR